MHFGNGSIRLLNNQDPLVFSAACHHSEGRYSQAREEHIWGDLSTRHRYVFCHMELQDPSTHHSHHI